ncbi:MAG: error-prone DNA polymerase [Planctomycetia bacterium]|nr:error-prone DNA polymerase [Planctomycetia bacterium]
MNDIGPRYAELHCTSNFSFLEGASHPEELVRRAHALGYEALAITDKGTLSGIVRAHAAAKDVGLKLIVGVELEPVDAAPLVLWAVDRTGYANLCRLLTRGHMRRVESKAARMPASGGCVVSRDDIAAHATGLLAGVKSPSWSSATGVADGGFEAAVAGLSAWREVFGAELYALAEVALDGDDDDRLQWLERVAGRAAVPLVAAGDVRYHERSRLPLFDALAAVRHGGTVESIRDRLLANGERHLHERRRIAERFAALPTGRGTVDSAGRRFLWPAAVEQTAEIAARCTFSLDELKYEYPDAIVPAGRTAAEHLADLAWKGAAKRYAKDVPEKVQQLLRHELALIAELGYETYFLTVFDIVRFARRRGILCQGRGSAANSCVCYCLGVTSVDPARMNVLFERFVSRERREAPDIDIDFEHDRREEVLQYIYETYGRSRAAMTAEVISYRLRSAVRDLAKVLGFSLDRVEAIAGVIDVGDHADDLPTRLAEAGLDPASDACTRLTTLVGQLIGFPRHLGQHVGGMVMTRGELCDLVPIQPATMEGRTIVQWDKNDLDELGILKVDCLALGMLSAIRRAFELVAGAGGPVLTLATVPAEDPAVYEMISRADTVGVFQIESRAQMSMLPRLKPACFYDLVIEVAIVRPGPIQGGMVHPYLRRRTGEEPVTYPNDAIREVLEKTLGVPLFQEQAMRLAVVAAGFTPGEADQLRRAMGAWRRPGVIDEFHRKLVGGMLARGLSPTFAEQVFAQIRGFGEYGFPESHAASFALLVYVSAWLKCHHPAAFTAALLGSQPMGFYAPAQLVRDARAHGVSVLPVDVNASGWHASLEVGSKKRRPDDETGGPGPAIRLGLEQVHGLGEAVGRRIEAARRDGPFRLPRDLSKRAELDRESLLHLARAGALASLGLDRRRAVWEAMQPQEKPRSRPLFEGIDDDADEDGWLLPATTRQEEVIADYKTGGLSLAAHPLEFERDWLGSLGMVTIGEAVAMAEGRRVKVAGIVLTRQRPATAKGLIFLTIEDETGAANIVVHPDVWEAASHQARRAAVLVVNGRIQRRGTVVHVLATQLEMAVPARAGTADDRLPCPTPPLATLPRMSRDFC